MMLCDDRALCYEMRKLLESELHSGGFHSCFLMKIGFDPCWRHYYSLLYGQAISFFM